MVKFRKILCALLTMSMLVSCMSVVSAANITAEEAAAYANMLVDKDAENGLSGISNVSITDKTAVSGTHSYCAENYIYNAANYNDVIDIGGLNFQKDKVYHISFWEKQESVSEDPTALWPGLKFFLVAGGQDYIMGNDEDYYAYINNGGTVTGRIAITKDSQWHFKSIVFKADKDYTNATIRWRADSSIKYAVNLYLDDISVREVPNPEKYVKSDGETSLFKTNVPYTCYYYQQSFNSKAKDNAQDIVESQITLKSAVASADSLTLVFNDTIGAALGECGVEAALIPSGIKGAAINGNIGTSVDAQNGTSTVIVPCSVVDETLPVEITGLLDKWGKKISDINIKSVEQSREKGNLITNAHCESLDYWALAGTRALDTADKKDGAASIKFSNVSRLSYPMQQNLSTAYIDPSEVVKFSVWTKSSTAGSQMRLTLRVNYIDDASNAKTKDIIIGDITNTGTDWEKTHMILRLSEKTSSYPEQERITGYMIYLLNLTDGTISSYNIDKMYFGYDRGITTNLSGVFYGVDRDGSNKTMTLAFTSSAPADKTILTADGIDESKIMLDYYSYDDITDCTETLNNVCVGDAEVSYKGYNTYIKYNINATEAFNLFENAVFLVRAEDIDTVDGSTVAPGEFDTQKTYNGGLMVSYKTAGYDGTAWTDSSLYDEMANTETMTAIKPVLYNASDVAIAPMGICAFYDSDASLHTAILRNYSEIAPGAMINGTGDSERFQFEAVEKSNAVINMLWWDGETIKPNAPVMQINVE